MVDSCTYKLCFHLLLLLLDSIDGRQRLCDVVLNLLHLAGELTQLRQRKPTDDSGVVQTNKFIPNIRQPQQWQQ